jgi:hypothetical protein
MVEIPIEHQIIASHTSMRASPTVTMATVQRRCALAR